MENQKSAASCESSVQCPDFERRVVRTLMRLGVPVNIKGFHYIKTAVMFSLENPIGMTSMSKMLYPAIAERYLIASTVSVERAIRYAIEQSCIRGDIGFIRQLFGCRDGAMNYNPTNREFLAVVSEYIKQSAEEAAWTSLAS